MQDSSLIRRHVSWRAVSRDAAVSLGCDSLEAPVSNQHSHCFNLSLLTSSACRHRFEPHLWLRWMPAVWAPMPSVRHTGSAQLDIEPNEKKEKWMKPVATDYSTHHIKFFLFLFLVTNHSSGEAQRVSLERWMMKVSMCEGFRVDNAGPLFCLWSCVALNYWNVNS